MISKTVREALGADEQIKKIFSTCNKHIALRIIGYLLNSLIVFAVISMILFFLDRGSSLLIKVNIDSFMPTGISDNSLLLNLFERTTSFLNVNSAEISQLVFNVWLLLAAFFVFALTPFVIFFNIFYIKISNEFLLTDKKMIIKNGWLNTEVKTVHYDQITDISVKQSFFDKILGSGTISVSTAGDVGYEIVLNHISRPYEIKRFLGEMRPHHDLGTEINPTSLTAH
jgi:membrane protein YdbS with pleckstrin-like domain